MRQDYLLSLCTVHFSATCIIALYRIQHLETTVGLRFQQNNMCEVKFVVCFLTLGFNIFILSSPQHGNESSLHIWTYLQFFNNSKYIILDYYCPAH
jgi:hypothetical protein